MDVKEKRIELILQQLEQLPTLPAVAVRVLEVTGHDEASVRQVVELIQSDPSLTARILQLVHRADKGVRGDVATVDRAVVLLGFEIVRSAAFALSVFQTFDTGEQPRQMADGARAAFNRDEFWRHSLAVACCSELLAEQLHKAGASNLVEPSEAFVCGLLHDLGKIALDTVLPKSFQKIVEAADLLRGNIADLERQIIGLDHLLVGKRLAEQWRLPALLRECMWLHGQSPEALPPSVKDGRIVNVVSLADLLAREQHLGYSGNYVFAPLREPLRDALNLTQESLAEAQQQLLARIEQRRSSWGWERPAAARCTCRR